MCDYTDIGDGRLIAAAEAPRARVASQYVFDRATTRIEPVPEPLPSGRPVEMELLFEIFPHPWNDKGMRVHSQHLCEPAYMRPCAQVHWQNR
jgi:hypothetical protein